MTPHHARSALSFAALLAVAVAACGAPAPEATGASSSAVGASDAQGTVCGGTPHLSLQGGGPRPGPATLVPVFWGFVDSQPSNRTGRYNVVYEQLEASNYYKWLEDEYGAPALSHLTPVSSTYAGTITGNISQSTLENGFASAIRNGQFLAPPNPVYVIHLPPGVTVTTSNGAVLCQNFNAYNSKFSSFDLLNGGEETFYYVVVPDETTCPNLPFNLVTRALSHEIAENLTDPDTNGWEDPQAAASCDPGGPVQIGDLCNNLTTTINSSFGYTNPTTGVTNYTLTVQKLWSNQVGACVTEDDTTAPTVSAISPNYGVSGTVVTITGTNFEGYPTVTIGSETATASCSSPTTCTFAVPPGTGSVPVTVALNDFTLSAGNFGYVPSPGCVPTSTCSSEYIPPGYGSPTGASTIETIGVSCLTQPQQVQQLVNGAWTALAPYAANTGYPPPEDPTVFDTVSSPAGSVQSIRACTIEGVDTVCDAPTSVTIENCGSTSSSSGGGGGGAGTCTGAIVDGKCIVVPIPKCGGTLPC